MTKAALADVGFVPNGLIDALNAIRFAEPLIAARATQRDGRGSTLELVSCASPVPSDCMTYSSGLSSWLVPRRSALDTNASQAPSLLTDTVSTPSS
jgi:hypothetical protein